MNASSRHAPGNDVEFLQRRRAAADSSIEGDRDLGTGAHATIRAATGIALAPLTNVAPFPK